MLTVVSSEPAELYEGVRNLRTRSAGVAVHRGCTPAEFTQLEFTMWGWSGPPLGLPSQNAGQRRGGREEALHRTADNFRTTSWSEWRAGSRARPSRQMLTASGLIEPDDDSDKRDVGGCLRIV